MVLQQHILLVEDDAALQNVLAMALRVHGYDVATAATVQEAEATMQQLGATAISLVIADINLTGRYEAREGYALYQRWTTAYPALRYLLISGDQRNTTLPAIHVGAVPFLAKPFGIRALVTTVEALLKAPPSQANGEKRSVETSHVQAFKSAFGGFCRGQTREVVSEQGQ